MAGKFEPKEPIPLAPPKDDPISVEELAKCNGKLFCASLSYRTASKNELVYSYFTGVDSEKCYVAIKGKVFDVTGKDAYKPGGSYHGKCSLFLSFRWEFLCNF